MYLLDMLNLIFALGGVALIPVTVGLYADYFFYESYYFRQWFQEFAWPAVMAITIGSVAISLLYSEYFGFLPCSLCWLQRIALYPQALLAVMAFRIKETIYFPLYSIALSAFGLIVAIYHYVYQLIPREVSTTEILPCLADGSADCAVKVIDKFGFVTFPLLSAITFALLIVIYMNLRRSR